MAYTKQTWETGEVITADKLNHIEDGINSAGTATNILDGSADGSVKTVAALSNIGAYAFACGTGTEASGKYSHAEGSGTTASGNYSHAEGYDTTASQLASHAEGRETTASGGYSHTEGEGTTASGKRSHTEGYSTIANGDNQHVQGKYNVEDVDNVYAFIIGNGNGGQGGRHNAFAVKWDGTFVFANGTEITPAQFASLLALLN